MTNTFFVVASNKVFQTFLCWWTSSWCWQVVSLLKKEITEIKWQTPNTCLWQLLLVWLRLWFVIWRCNKRKTRHVFMRFFPSKFTFFCFSSCLELLQMKFFGDKDFFWHRNTNSRAPRLLLDTWFHCIKYCSLRP